MQLLVLTRPTRTLEVDAGTDGAELRAAIGRAFGLPMEHFYVLHRGRLLSAETPAGLLRPGDSIRLAPRLRGGGGDGGVYPPTAAELKWMTDIGGGSKRGSWAVLGGSVSRTQFERVPQQLRRFEACKTCALTGEPLAPPVVACELGCLYNKAAVIEALLNKSARPLDDRFAHLTSLKDLTAVTLHADPEQADAGAARGKAAAQAASSGADEGVTERASFYCPVTKLPFNGRHRFYAVRPSGHVVSERALAMTHFALCPLSEVALRPAAAHAEAVEPTDGAPARKPLSPDLLPLVLSDEQFECAQKQLRATHAARRAKKPKAQHSQGAPAAAGAETAGAAPKPSAARSALDASRGASATPQGDPGRAPQSSAVYASLFLPQHVRDEADRRVREGKDYMTRAIQPGVKKQ
jgi:hypothetical protein